MPVAVALLWVAAPHAAWGQSSWPSYPNNSAISATSGGNVGIGTTSPSARLHVAGSDIVLAVQSSTTNSYLTFHNSSNLTAYSNSISVSNADLFLGGGGNGTIHLRNVGTGGWVDSMTILPSGNVGIGTTSPQHKLAVNGSIGAKDIIVTNSGWPDYVFRPGYRLRPLGEVRLFIQENGHLPDIPTEAEVKENGISLGDMQAKLLAKVEELTLHMIQADERNERLERQNREFRERIARLEKAATADSTPATAK